MKPIVKGYKALTKAAGSNPLDEFMSKFGNEQPVPEMAGGGEPFKQLVKAYKLFQQKPKDPENLYPLFVNANTPVPVGEWLKAESGPRAASGKVKSKLGELAYRPGWHAGDLPLAPHIGAKSDPRLKGPDVRPENQVWAEIEMPADIDWQKIANERALRNKMGEIISNTAHITDEIPFGGHYRYKTNPNMLGNWMISGDMRVNRVLAPEEVMAINESTGLYDLPRFSKLPKKAEGGLAHLAGGGQPVKMLQQVYRGFAGKPNPDEAFVSPQMRVADYYAAKRASQTGLQPGVEALLVDPFAGKKYGHSLPIDKFNKEFVTTQARKLSPLDIIDSRIIEKAKGGSTTPAWQRKEGKNPEGGLNAKGRASYKADTGGTLKPPVSAEAAKKSPAKAARRKSFCARMSGMPGPMKDEKGRPTRKALALRKWDC